MQVPDGWLQVIRGPPPASQKWPRGRQPASRGRARALKLEAAMQAVGESDPAYPGLLEALKKTRVQAQVKHVQDRITGTKSFLERARKRVFTSRQEVEKSQRGTGHSRTQVGFRGRRSSPREPPTVPADFALELTRLQSFVQEFSRERGDLRAQGAAQSVVSEDRPRKTNRSQHRRQI